LNTLDTPQNREIIIQSFPGLRDDPEFKITSLETSNYNCIAWAVNRTNSFWWPLVPQPDGTYWPLENKSEDFKNLIDAYSSVGYRPCEDWVFEVKYKKIALYIDNETGRFTHASRQLRNGLWTSKLGPYFDITHSTPFTIEGKCYGNVNAYMSSIFNSFL
jgi:hypothetical protein